MTTQTLHPTLTARIETISRKYGPQADDVRSHVTLAVLEKLQNPKFATQQIGYHIKFAKWAAAKYQQKATRYERYIADEPQAADNENETDDVWSAIDEAIPGDVSAEERERRRLETQRGMVQRQEQWMREREAALETTARQIAPTVGH